MTADGRPTTKGRRAGAGRSRSSWCGRRSLGVLGAMAALAAVVAPAGASAASLPHGLGLIPTPAPKVSGLVAGAMNAEQATLPASVSLTGDAMPVGDQGQVGSCAAWSTDYSALGYWENKEAIAGGGLEPMYTYSQVDGGVDNGSTIEGNLQIDETQGIDTSTDYWQGDFDYTDQPTAAEKLNAVNWKLSTYSNLRSTRARRRPSRRPRSRRLSPPATRSSSAFRSTRTSSPSGLPTTATTRARPAATRAITRSRRSATTARGS